MFSACQNVEGNIYDSNFHFLFHAQVNGVLFLRGSFAPGENLCWSGEVEECQEELFVPLLGGPR